jgi:hypothetical protein
LLILPVIEATSDFIYEESAWIGNNGRFCPERAIDRYPGVSFFQSWVERRGSNGQQECGIRYWPEKGGHPIVKWLPTKAVPLARRAIDDIRELCNEARGVALWLEEHPGKVPALPGYADSDVLIGGVLARPLGFSA